MCTERRADASRPGRVLIDEMEPELAVRLRERLEHLLGDEHAHFLELAGTIREPLAERMPSFDERKALWYRLVDSDVLDLLRGGDEQAARQRIADIMGVAPA